MSETIRSGITQYSVRKISTLGAIKGAGSHNDRFDLEKFVSENKNTAKHIDARRTGFNRVIEGEPFVDYWSEVVKRATGKEYSTEELESIKKEDLRYEDGRKVYKNAVLAMEGKINFPGEMQWSKFDDGEIVPLKDDEEPDAKNKGHFLWPVNMDELKEWEEKTIVFTKERFGEENIIQAQVHMDETTPHMHVVFTPSYTREDGTRHFSVEKIGLSNKFDLSRLQTDYAQALSGMNYVRGAEYSTNVKKYTVAEYRSLLAKELEQELPEPLSGQTAQEYKDQIADPTYKVAIAHNTELKIQFETRNASARTLQKLRKELEEKKKELEEKEKEIEELESALKKSKQINRDQVFEARGIELAEDQNTIQNIYIPLKESLIDVGRSDYEARGFEIEHGDDHSATDH